MSFITGYGVICNLGSDTTTVIENLIGLHEYQENKYIDYPRNYDGNYRTDLCVVAEVPLSDRELYHKLNITCKSEKDITRSELLAVHAITEALSTTNLNYSQDRIGIFCGTSQASTTELEKFYKYYKIHKKIKRIKSLLSGSYTVPNDTIAQHFGFMGPRICISTACSSSLIALYVARTYLETNQIDAAVVYGVDPISELVISGFKSLQAMAEPFSSPFSKKAVGMSLGEGAAAIVVERNSSQAKIEIVGVGASSDAHHITAPDPFGYGAGMAITEAREQSLKCDVIYAHGSGTQSNDECEANALISHFGFDSLSDTPVLSIKGNSGHTLGTAGLLNLVLACEGLNKGIIPQSGNIGEVREECANINVNKQPIIRKVQTSLVNAFGFGGNNASALIKLKNSDEYISDNYDPKPVYITGHGFITPIGDTIEDVFEHIQSIKSAPHTVAPVISFTQRHTSSGAATVDEYWSKIDKKIRKLKSFRKFDRFSKLFIYSALTALHNSVDKWQKSHRMQLPVILGTGTGPMSVIHEFYDGVLENGIMAGNAGIFPNNVMNACLGFLSIEESLCGPTILNADHELASCHALKNGWLMLNDRRKNHKKLLVGGADEYSTILEKGYLDILAVGSNSRNGYTMSEMAACITLETQPKDVNKIHAIYKGGIERYLTNSKSDESLFVFYCEFFRDLLIKFGNPDLILFSTKNIKRHDEILCDALNVCFKEIPYYNPVEQFGYSQGSMTMLNVILSIAFFKYNQLPTQISSLKKSVNKIFVVTLNEYKAISSEILERFTQ